MGHRRVQARLSAYLEDEIAGRERARLELHLEECDACATELRELRETVGLLRSLPDPEVPRDFAANVMAQLRAEEERPGFAAALRRRLGVWLDAPWSAPLAAAAMSLAVFVAVGDLDVSAVWNAPTPAQPAVLASAPPAPKPRVDTSAELERILRPAPPGTRRSTGGPLVTASAAPPEGQEGRAGAPDLPPLAVCLNAPAAGASALASAEREACARWDAYMLGLARQDLVSFQDAVKRLSAGQQDRLLKRLKEFAVRSGSAPLRAEPELPFESRLPKGVAIDFGRDTPTR